MNKRERIERARVAGSVSTPEKAAAARANGKKRKMNPEIARIMEERNCSRQRAHIILKNVLRG